MTKNKSTKRALLISGLALLMCISMLIGSTFAWFTDSVTSAGNKIQSGTLDIALEYSTDGGTTWEDAENKTLEFKTADNRTTEILWEPGCTYELPAVRVRNNGNLALKYQIVINGVTGSAKLLEAIDFTANGNAISTFTGHLDTNGAVSEAIVIKGHMKEEAGNEYQNLTIEGIGITVYATQYTYENDSFGNQYDLLGEGQYMNGTFAAGPINSGRLMANGGRYQIAADLTNVSGVKTLAVNVLDQYGKLMTTVTPEGYQIPADGKIDSLTVAAVVVGNSSSWQNTAFVPNVKSVPTTMELVVNGAVIGVTGVKPIANASPTTWEDVVNAYYAANNITVIDTADELKTALVNGGDFVLNADINGVDANTAITVAAGKNVNLDLNGHKITATANKTGNQELFLVKGSMNVKNGTLEFTAQNNQGWGSMATIFDVTAGGALKVDGVTANVAGTDMNFFAHLNNWGSAALEMTNCDITTTYVAVRAFNSGYDMNTVTIKDTDFHNGRMFWVHNYTSEGKDDSTLTLDIYGNNNTSDNAKPVRFGFDNSVYYDINGNLIP